MVAVTSSPPPTAAPTPGLFGWLRDSTPDARRALAAASFGWMLDSFDVMLYAIVLASMMSDLAMDKTTAGWLGSLMLLAGAAGGLFFGVIADRFGRTRALIGSVLIYSFATAAHGFSQSIAQLAVFRIALGFGMGGEWASGAALVSETWPAASRGKALGLMQSAWAVGYALAAIVAWLVMDVLGGSWRIVFFVGILPALLTLWVRRNVKEPDLWLERQRKPAAERARASEILRGPRLKFTIALVLMNACCLFAWWGFNSWIPAYLKLPVNQGGVGLGGYATLILVVMQVGMFFGYVTFGFVSDNIGRKRTYIGYLLMAAVLMFAYGWMRQPIVLLLLAPLVAFFATGYFSGLGAVTAEIYPTDVRARAQAAVYNIGRIVSAAAPFTLGKLADSHGFGTALSVAAAAFLVAAFAWFWIPETKGRVLE
jgi:MFS family permease